MHESNRPTRSSLPFGTRVVAGAFFAQAISIGLPITAYPVFVASIENDLGASRTQVAMGIPLILVTGAFASPFIGRVLDRGRTRIVMLIGAVLMALGFLAISRASSLAMAALVWALLVGLGHAMIGPIPAATMLANWFIEKRGRMIAIAAMGTTFGGMFAPPLAHLLVESVGWRGAMLAFAAISVGLGLPTVLLGIRGRPEEVGLLPDGATAGRLSEGEAESAFAAAATVERGPSEAVAEEASILLDPRFWLVALGFGVIVGVSVGYVTHIVEWAIERGLDRDEAVGILTINAIFAASGKLLFGALTDRLGARRALFYAVFFLLVGWGGLLFAPSSILFACSAAVFGIGLGCTIPCQAGLVASMWGRERFGQVSGLIGLVSLLGPFLVPILLGRSFEALGSYETPMLALWLIIGVPGLAFAAIRSELPERASRV